MPLGGEKKAEGASVKRQWGPRFGPVFVREYQEPLNFSLYCGTLRFSGRNFVREADGSGIIVNPKCVWELEDQKPHWLRPILRAEHWGSPVRILSEKQTAVEFLWIQSVCQRGTIAALIWFILRNIEDLWSEFCKRSRREWNSCESKVCVRYRGSRATFASIYTVEHWGSASCTLYSDLGT